MTLSRFSRPFHRAAIAAALLLILSACASTTPAPVETRTQPLNELAGGSVSASVGAGYHSVQKGETLYSISLRYNQDYRDIATWNGLADPWIISVGQVLRIVPPNSATGNAGVTTAPVTSGMVVERSLDAQPAATTGSRLKREPLVNKEPYTDAAYARAQNPVSTPVTSPPATPASATVPPATVSSSATPVANGVTWSWPAKGKTIGSFAQTKGIDIAGQAGDPVAAAADGKVVYAGSGLRGYGQLIIIKHNETYLTAYAHNRKILVKEGQSVKRGARIAEMGNTDSDAVKLHFEVRKQGKPVEPLDFLPRQ
ncbi:MAG: peptidoglycan DD-metalloendopeptidase family protein [Zoogloeaceae bacterium]|jgi:lipoprotein NlpD|nr:peptidoglycan DD-metalloendopeptidase family protein [Zoogloeaceae bacterium]